MCLIEAAMNLGLLAQSLATLDDHQFIPGI